MAAIRPDDFTFLQNLLKTRSGLVVTPDKSYLLESRLTPVARSFGYADIGALVTKLRGNRDEKLAKSVIDAMTTNESSFFRDSRPFDQFRKTVLPALVKARAGQRKLRIWSAACSSGQEAYSIGISLLEDRAAWTGFKVDILGTDLSTDILTRAQEGKYSQFEVQRGLPIQLLVKYFDQAGDRWQIKRDLRSMVQWREFNLLDSLSSLGSFDIVFCRNVLIYFDQPTKRRVLEAIARQMPEDGYLFLGGAETVLGITDRFQPADGLRGIYQLAGAAKAGRAKTGVAAMRPAAVASKPSASERPAASGASVSAGATRTGAAGATRTSAPGGNSISPGRAGSAGLGRGASTGAGGGTGTLRRYSSLSTKR